MRLLVEVDLGEDPIDVKLFAKEIKRHLQDDYDCVLAVTSTFEGMGKSTLTIQLGREIDSLFGLERNILFSPTVKSMKDLIFSLPKYSVVDADEAIKVLYKLKWGDKLTIFINQLYALCRQENLATILPMPRIQDFVEFFRNHKIKFWIHVVTRGTAVIMFKDDNPFSPDPWHIKENFKIYTKFRSMKKAIFYTIDEKLGAFKKCTNFVGILKFDDLDPETKLQYRNLKRMQSYGEIEGNANFNAIQIFEHVKTVLADSERYVKMWQGRPIVDLDKIMINFNVGRVIAAQIKKMAEEDVTKKYNEKFRKTDNKEMQQVQKE